MYLDIYLCIFAFLHFFVHLFIYLFLIMAGLAFHSFCESLHTKHTGCLSSQTEEFEFLTV